MKSLVLFSNDLRLNDNEAICSAIDGFNETSFIFLYDEDLYNSTHGSANLWWLEKSLKSLKIRLQDKNICLHIVKGCLLYTSPSPRDLSTSRMPSSA